VNITEYDNDIEQKIITIFIRSNKCQASVKNTNIVELPMNFSPSDGLPFFHLFELLVCLFQKKGLNDFNLLFLNVLSDVSHIDFAIPEIQIRIIDSTII